MLGDAGDLSLVRELGGEGPVHQVVVHRSTLLLAAAAFTGRDRPQLLIPAQSPHQSLTDGDTGPIELVGEEPIPERRVVGMNVDECVCQIRAIEITAQTQVGPPLVEDLKTEPGHPTPDENRVGFLG